MPMTPDQLRVRARFERLIALAAPILDIVLATGERISRIAGREDEPIPIRAAGEAFELRPAPRQRARNGDDPTTA